MRRCIPDVKIALATAILASLAAPALSLGQSAPATSNATLQEARKDPILGAMLDELDRSKAELQLQGFERPFFIEYRLEDLEVFGASSTFGSLTGEQTNRRRIARITVRVGDYKTDSSSRPEGANAGESSLQITSVDDDPAALRYALWAATDTAYKGALRSLSKKQSELKSVQTPPQADDFSHEQPIVVLQPLKHLDLDKAAWKLRLDEASGLYREMPKPDPAHGTTPAAIEFSSADLSAQAINTYQVNTEGTILRTATSLYRASIQVSGQAPDGMNLSRFHNTDGPTAADLDSPTEFRRGAVEAVATLRALEAAPVVDTEYHGPILLESQTAANKFEQIFAPAIAAPRPNLGTELRTTGPFASSYKARVLPDFFTVTDDPTIKTFAGKPLLGAYEIDDEGVPARPVKIVDEGKLVNYVIGRQPVRDFPASNGHGRAQIASPPQPHYAVLHIEVADPLPPAGLEARLIAIAKERGLPQVYIAANMGLIYRITVADGHRELVRGAELGDLDLRALRSAITAAGSDNFVLNMFTGIPSTVIAPSLLFDDAVVKRADRKNEKLPYYPHH